MRAQTIFFGLAAMIAAFTWNATAESCPFCSAVKQTFCEEIAANDVALIVKLVQRPERPAGKVNSLDAAPGANLSKFEVVETLRGGDVLGDQKRIEAMYFGDAPTGASFLLMGLAGEPISWATPILMTDRSTAYLREALPLPAAGVERLEFFQNYLQDAEELIAADAYDEFAKAPFSDIKLLAPRMNHEQIVAWVKNPEVTPSKRRLFLTMLSVCGRADDAEFLQGMIESKDREAHKALDALIAAFLTLRGADGLALVDDLFLKNQEAEYTDTWAALMAIRFHGQEEKIIPRSRLTQSLRYMLDRPKLADTVVNDLARWEDWTVMDRLVELFKRPDEDLTFIRVPVVNYLRVCPLPAAREHLAELTKLDPKSVKQAETFFPSLKPVEPGAAQRPAGEKPSEQRKSAADASTSPAAANSAAPQLAGNGTPAAASADDATNHDLSGDDAQEEEEDAAAGLAPQARAPLYAPSRWQLGGILATAGVGLWIVFTLLLSGSRGSLRSGA